jgi:tetratricopeptide (TPR) repeat protein
MGLLLLLSPLGAFEYRFEDNVAEFLDVGTKAFKAGRFEAARIELENVLLMAPGSAAAHDLLVRVYGKLGELGLAHKMLQRIRQGGLLGEDRLQELEAEIAGETAGEERVTRGSFWDGKAPALPPPGAAAPSGESRLASVGELEEVDLDDGLENLLDDLDGPGEDVGKIPTPTRAPEPVKLPRPVASPPVTPSSDPLVLHAQAVNLYKRTGSAIKAGALLVKALEMDPGLLAEPDGGLWDATYTAYTEKVKKDSDNLDARFVLAFLEEKRGEEDAAVMEYESIARKAPPGSRLAKVSQARGDMIRAEQRRLEEERLAQVAADARAKLEHQLAKIEVGEHPDVKDAMGFREKGKEAHKTWEESRDDLDLRAALAWYKGAIFKEPGNGENQYLFALVKIDQAADGDDQAREEARQALEKALTLKPPDRVRLDAENLLKALTR